MEMMIRTRRRRLAKWKIVSVFSTVVLFAVMASPAPVANAVGSTIQGSGSTWSFPMVNQWRADASAQGTNVTVQEGGSSVGRQQFAQTITDFGDSDIPYQGQDPLTKQDDTALGRGFAYIPIIAGGTSLQYHLELGGQLIRGVRISDLTMAKIFTGVITNWGDPEITADMNGHKLPSVPIQVIVNSQGAGTTFQFTDYLAKHHGDLWSQYCGCPNLATSYYPISRPNFSGQPGDDRIAATIEGPNSNGAIGFVQYSYPFVKNYPVLKVLNTNGFFILPTPGNTALALQSAGINLNSNDPNNYLTQDLSPVYTAPDPRVYILSSYSYMIIPSGGDKNASVDKGKAQTFANFLYYSLCDGQAEAPRLGYSPLPYVLVQRAFDQIPKITNMDSGFLSGRDPSTCNNPTFDHANLNRNLLAETDPFPPQCDHIGFGPCGFEDGNSLGGAGGANGAGAAKGAGAGAAGPNNTNANGNGNGADANGAGAGANGAGADDGSNADASGSGAGANGDELAAYRNSGLTLLLGILAAAELVVVLVTPAIVDRITRRRSQLKGLSS
jgi:phosphate transport system substrate-binding protein